MGFPESKERSGSKETRASRVLQGYKASKGNQDHRARWGRGVLMVHLARQDQRVSLVTWDHRERMALKDQRERQEPEVYLGHEDCLAWRVMRARSDQQAHQDLRVEWAEKDFLGRLGQRDSRERPESQEMSGQWEKEAWWVSSDLWGRRAWQERRGIEGRWAFLDHLEKRDRRVTQGHLVRPGLQDHQADQALLERLDHPAPEDPKACGER